MRNRGIRLVGFFLLAVESPILHAAVVINENFDSYTSQTQFVNAWPVYTQTSPATPTSSLTLSTEQSQSGLKSVKSPAVASGTVYRNRRDFSDVGFTSSTDRIIFSADFYDSGDGEPQPNYVELRDTASGGGGSNQLIAMGLNDNQASFDSGGNYYMARIQGFSPIDNSSGNGYIDPDGGPNESVTGASQFFKLNDNIFKPPYDSPGRSAGWHNLKVVLTPSANLTDTDYVFYVDQKAVETVKNVVSPYRGYDRIALGAGLSNNGVAAYFDNVKLEKKTQKLMWNFDNVNLQSGLPPGWKQDGQYGSWSVTGSAQNTGSGTVLTAKLAPAPTRILYYVSNNAFQGSFDQAISSLGSISYLHATPTFSPEQFTYELQSGNYDVAVFIQKGDALFQYADAFQALSRFVTSGGLAIASDSNTYHASIESFGATFTGSTSANSMTVTNSSLAQGIVNPVLLNPEFESGLNATTGISAATFSGGAGSAIVIGNNGRSIFNGFSTQSFANASIGGQLYYNELGQVMYPGSFSPASGADFPSQNDVQVRLDALTPWFRLSDPDNAEVNLDLNVAHDPNNNGLDHVSLSLVYKLNNQLLSLDDIWDFVLGGTEPVLPFRLKDVFGQNPQVDKNTDFQLRIRVADGDTYLASTTRVEIDNLSITEAVLVGDYNGDQKVDIGDYLVWRKTNINGQAGYTAWRSNFGADASGFAIGSGLGSGTSVPEPGVAVLLGIAVGCLGSIRHARTSSRLRNGY